MNVHRILNLVVTLSLFLFVSCGATVYYNSTVTNLNQAGNETYIEFQLLKDGSFKEYIYFGLNDSIDNSNEGLLISGTYFERKDTLFLSYSDAQKLIEMPTDLETYRETYKITEEGLVLLEPITYSYHLMNRKMDRGQSIKMRNLPNYATIQWLTETNN